MLNTFKAFKAFKEKKHSRRPYKSAGGHVLFVIKNCNPFLKKGEPPLFKKGYPLIKKTERTSDVMNTSNVLSLKDELRGKLKDYLGMKGLPTERGKKFICLNPDHDDKHPSMSYNPNKDQVHCFSCGASYDIFDLVGIEYGLKDFFAQYRKACQIFGYPIPVSRQETGMEGDIFLLTGKYYLKGEKDDKAVNLCASAYKNRRRVMSYLKGRGIDERLAERYGIGYYYGYRILGNAYDVVVFPVSQNSYMVRNVDRKSETECRYYKYGSPFPAWNLEAITEALESGRPLFVTEGIIDALSIITAGGVALALNGVGNIDELVSAIREETDNGRKNLTVIASCDNDDAGKEANGKLSVALKQAGIACHCLELYGRHKDANEALVRDRERFVTAIRLSQTEQGLNRMVYEQEESDGASVQGFRDRVIEGTEEPFIKTGFPALDEILHGGLFPGLYILGSLPSIGKTTLWVQLKDNFCSQGRNVLFFSLETSREDLWAKTVSRLMYERCVKDGLGLSLAKDSVGVKDGRLVGRYGEEERRLLWEAYDECRLVSRKCRTYDGLDIDMEMIETETADFIAKTGIKPIVMVDYIQILGTRKNIMDERQRTVEVVGRLKDLALRWDIPVMAISSINRNNYNNGMSFIAFMGSNGLEYRANCLLGVQYRRIGEKGFDLQKAESADVRQLELVVLKNKDGVKNAVIPIDYVPKYNCFVEPARTNITVVGTKRDEVAEPVAEGNANDDYVVNI